jgi:DNA-binding transcriptional LysR family regulator
LNLLVALDALLTERSVTRAAARIGVTQSAASHALARLRKLTNDELLVRSREGMVPTVRAEAMAAPLRRALEDLRGTLAPQRKFEPKTARLRVYIATSDYAELVLLPGVMARLGREAPTIELRVVALRDDYDSDLGSGKLDIALTPPLPTEGGFGMHRREVLRERFVCVTRRGHKLAKKGALTLASFAAASHALIAPWGKEGGMVDDALARLGLQRRVTVTLPHALVAPYVVASSDLLLTMPERSARAVAAASGLTILEPPSELRLGGFSISLVWHEKTDADFGRAWLRNVIAAEAAKCSA